MVTQQQLLQ